MNDIVRKPESTKLTHEEGKYKPITLKEIWKRIPKITLRRRAETIH